MRKWGFIITLGLCITIAGCGVQPTEAKNLKQCIMRSSQYCKEFKEADPKINYQVRGQSGRMLYLRR